LPLQGIRGHDRIVGSLSRALEEGRLASSLLFHGPAGVGKLTVAMALCRSLLCARTAPTACNDCDACRRIEARALLHPDIGLLHPQPRKENAPDPLPPEPLSSPDLQTLQDEVRRNATWRIPVGRARERLSDLSLSPALGSHRILVVLSAERLSEESGNALLKALEEPPGSALILLLCENISVLLPTLRSRCQPFRFAPLSRRRVEQFLLEQPGSEPDQVLLIASLSGGRPGLALSLLGSAAAYRSRRSDLTRVFSQVRREKTPAACLACASGLLAEGGGPTDDLDILMDLLRDSMLRAAGCDPSLLSDPAPASPGSDLGLTAAEAAHLLVRVEQAREDLRRYGNRQLALESLLLDLTEPATLLSAGE